MEKLPHYNFSWTVSLEKICETLRLEISPRSHSLDISVWKRLWTCRETDKYLIMALGHEEQETAKHSVNNIIPVEVGTRNIQN
jgi:hypothetical protein